MPNIYDQAEVPCAYVEYEVRVDNFSGPIDVLLKLVTTSEVDLYDIAISDIVNAFCAQIEEHGEHNEDNLESVTQFLVPAAILVELKSRKLLPAANEYDLADELAIYEERDVALARLIEGHTFADGARRLRQLLTEAARHYQRQSGPDERFALAAPDPLTDVGPADIAAALRAVLAYKPEPKVDIAHIAAPPKTVEQCAYELVQQLPGRGRITFRELTEHIVDPVIVVAHFLALLELYKLGHVELAQLERFGNIEILWLSDATNVDLSEIADHGLGDAESASNRAALIAAAAGEFAA